MKVLIYGGRGWIGQQFIKVLKDKNVDFEVGKNKTDYITEIKDVTPTHVVSFIGRTHGEGFSTIDYLEQPGKLKENINDNLFSPIMIAEACRGMGVHVTYMGTGCIFTGDETTAFTEDSHPNFYGSSYSTVKGFTDRLMRNYDNVLNLRIRMPITDQKHPRNFITKITTYEKICSIPNSMSVLPLLLPYVVEMMDKNTTGTLNFTNPGVISHNEILEMYKEFVDSKFEWKNFSQEEQRQILLSERSNNHLDTTRLETLFPAVPSIHEAVKWCLERYNIGKNVLVTGGCGFIGSHFINSFDEYDTLVNIDALYYCSREDAVDPNKPNYTFVKNDLSSCDFLIKLLKKYSITHVVHFAAQSHVQNSFQESLQYTRDNVVGTHNLLEACRNYGSLKTFLHISTDEVYGDKSVDTMKTEQSIMCPTNPYSATKAGAELIVQSYIHSFNMPIMIARMNNVYGPHQHKEKVIPRFIDQLLNGEKITIHGDGSSTRDFMYVSDTVSALKIILERGEHGEIYNVGCDPDNDITILELAKKLIKITKNTEDFDDYLEFVPDRPYNDKRYYISNEKLKSLGWTQCVKFNDVIKDNILF